MFSKLRSDMNKGHGDLKNDVTDAVEEVLKYPRAEFAMKRPSLGKSRGKALWKPWNTWKLR